MNGSIWNFLTITYTITITSAAFQVAFGAKVWLQLVTNNSCYLDLPFPSRTSSASTAPFTVCIRDQWNQWICSIYNFLTITCTISITICGIPSCIYVVTVWLASTNEQLSFGSVLHLFLLVHLAA
jgi:hypothetical protein